MAEKKGRETVEFQLSDFQKKFEDLTARAICQCTLVTDCVGGQPADEKGVRQFVEYHLKLVGTEAEEAVKRILSEEIGEKDILALKASGEEDEGAELKEREVYGINIVRRDKYGPWLGNWMIKACLKAAASRIGLFKKKLGTKGDLAEMGRAMAYGDSLRNQKRPDQIYVYDPRISITSKTPVDTHYEKFMGRVTTPQGSKSIVHWSEVIPAGAKFDFEYRFGSTRFTKDDVVGVFALAQNIGLGSVKAMERGKFQIDKMTLEIGKAEKAEKAE